MQEKLKLFYGKVNRRTNTGIPVLEYLEEIEVNIPQETIDILDEKGSCSLITRNSMIVIGITKFITENYINGYINAHIGSVLAPVGTRQLHTLN